MKLDIINIKDYVSKGYLKQGTTKKYIDHFKKSLKILLDELNLKESEEHNKNIISDFLKKIFKEDEYKINTYNNIDLSISNKNSKNIGVIIETKSLKNKIEFPTKDNINVKAFHELILYYLKEKNKGNNNIKNLIITNGKEWFIFDVDVFYINFYVNKSFFNSYLDFENKKTESTNTYYFYKEIAKPFLDTLEEEINFCYFNLENIKEEHIIFLSKTISPVGFLKENYQTDNNTLDKGFYSELLHILGLEEVKGNKILIKRKKENNRNKGSLLENTISTIDTLKKIDNFRDDVSVYGKNKEDQIFNISLELCITWINRILFLKLLEGQIINYNKDKNVGFLSHEKIKNFNELNTLFFDILAKKIDERNSNFKEFENIPYLNSSLFEISYIENEFIVISNLNDNIKIPIYFNTVLIDQNDKKISGELNTIEYLFRFLDSYDFASDGSLGNSLIRENNKTLINASVLGLVFEKINGYKDGSFYTPSFITMYMCRETIRKVVLDKFNEINKWNCKDFSDLYNKIKDKKQANKIIDNIKICDPSVGSGHFLVSALNEIILIKKELEILIDEEGKLLKNYDFEIQNDEIIITDEENNFFEYNRNSKESLRVQKTLFNEKRKIIENCLFGVDINPNSVKICNLRLWIELLKNAYYKEDTNDLETLPNIDINIKCGNSLVSKLDLFLKPVFIDSTKQSAYHRLMKEYKEKVWLYKNYEGNKLQIRKQIKELKDNISLNIPIIDKDYTEIKRIENDISDLLRNTFDITEAEKKKLDVLNTKLLEKQKVYNEKQDLFKNSFEWRLEFPEVLDDEGNFLGFDAIIGNPPYIDIKNIDTDYVKLFFDKYTTTVNRINLYSIFLEKGFSLLNKKGKLAYIIPNSLLMNDSYFKIRKLILDKVTKIIKLPDSVFDKAIVETIIIVLDINNKKKNIDSFYFKNDDKNNLLNLEFENKNKELWKEDPLFKFNIFIDDKENTIINKISKNYKCLQDYAEFSLGITPYDKFKGHTEEQIKNRIFHSDKKIDDCYVPLIEGSNIKRYNIDINHNEFLKYGDWLGASRDIRFFKNPKILVRQILFSKNLSIISSYTEEEIYFTQIGFSIIAKEKSDKNLKYILALLNSKTINFFHVKKYLDIEKNIFPKILIANCKQFPIPDISKKKQRPFIDLVDAILEKKSKGEETINEEQEIDNMVYKLYNLTNEDIDVVEGRKE